MGMKWSRRPVPQEQARRVGCITALAVTHATRRTHDLDLGLQDAEAVDDVVAGVPGVRDDGMRPRPADSVPEPHADAGRFQRGAPTWPPVVVNLIDRVVRREYRRAGGPCRGVGGLRDHGPPLAGDADRHLVHRRVADDQ
jgi:hypothetical protein